MAIVSIELISGGAIARRQLRRIGGSTQSTTLGGSPDEFQQGIGRQALVTLAMVQDIEGPLRKVQPNAMEKAGFEARRDD
jgi:hypothetical protein